MTLRAGAAVVDISPSGAVALFGYPHVERLASGVHDPLLASALWLDNGRERVMLIALDLLMLDPPMARTLRATVAAETGVSESGVLISCTHTHSGPVTARPLSWSDDPAVPPPDAAYLDELTARVIKAATSAMSAAQPARIAWTTADGRGVGGNRVIPDGATDPEVGILSVREAASGSPLAVVLIYGMHPTVLHEDSTLISSDFPHYARLAIRERFGQSLPVLYHTAPCGDQSPRFFVHGQTFAEAERLGRKLGEAAVARLEDIDQRDYASDCVLGGVIAPIDLPRRRFPSLREAELLLEHHRDEFERLKAERAETARIRTAECAVFGAEGTLTLARLQERGDLEATLQAALPVELQVLQVGEVSLVGLPGEWFIEHGLELKRRWPGKAFVISLVNGHLQGYITTQQAVAIGGYEALNAVFDGPETGRRMIQTALQLRPRCP